MLKERSDNSVYMVNMCVVVNTWIPDWAYFFSSRFWAKLASVPSVPSKPSVAKCTNGKAFFRS